MGAWPIAQNVGSFCFNKGLASPTIVLIFLRSLHDGLIGFEGSCRKPTERGYDVDVMVV